MNKGLSKTIRGFLLAGITVTLAACGNQSSAPQANIDQSAYPAPTQLQAKQLTPQAFDRSLIMPVPQAVAEKALSNYRINKRGEQSPYQYRGVDLNSDGRAEIVAYFTGGSWCAKAGCTLVVLTPDQHGYRPVSTIRRVKLPIRLSRDSNAGWRTMVANTGGVTGPVQAVALKFNSFGYPGNAMLLPPIPIGGDMGGETIFALPANPVASGPQPLALNPRPANPNTARP